MNSQKWIEILDGNVVVISTTELSKKQFAQYMEMCEAFGAEFAKILGFNPADDNETDAIIILRYVMDPF